ncbi:uncharacterized protein BJX67DRAFT_228030 [Aspergillus lucknowensis]|uniref:SWR1-complex protein 3 domain-containing protein n=1 Tax=Aspergillus lucknowensis TaxID=176173 RepID=A0ABR4LI84_9EURO
MAEKRRLPPRERREPAAKRRVSEATTRALSPTQPQTSSKRKASTPAVAPSSASTPLPEPGVVEPPLPSKIKDGEGLPTLPSPQPSSLSPKEYQSIAESAVLLASLERSKKKWLSDGILVRYWTKPKKTKREQLEGKNPPKESMSKVGPCNIVVGPHLFDAMLYTVKDPNAPPPVQYTPNQRPMVHYGPANNFQQYNPYPHPHQSAQSQRPHPPQASHGTPTQQGYPQSGRPPPSQPARAPNSQTPHRSSGPQATQRPAPHQQPAPQPPRPNPDPVIQMLATRAAQDPELKALMRLVASTNATQEQLRTFQAHIDELNAIIRQREQQQRRQQQQQQQQRPPSQPPTPSPAQPSHRSSQPAVQTPQQPPSQKPQQPPPATPHQQQTPTSQPPSHQSSQPRTRVEIQIPKPPPAPTSQNSAADSKGAQSSTSEPTPTPPQVKQEPGLGTTVQTPTPGVSSPSVASGVQQGPATQTAPPPPQQQQAVNQRPSPQYPQYQQTPYQGQPPAIQSRPPQYGSPSPYYRATPSRPPPLPKLNYKSVVIEFTSPLTPYGSSTSGHAGSGDRYLFPENTILEWLPGGTTVLASFLVVRKADPNTPFPIETSSDVVVSRAKGKSASKSKKAEKDMGRASEGQKQGGKSDDGAKATKDNKGPQPQDPSAVDHKPLQEAQADQTTASGQPISDSQQGKEKPDDDKKSSNLKEYYQPVTFKIYSNNPRVLEPLARVVKPQDEVRKYMDEIMDRAERAPEGFLAYQLPRESSAEDNELENDKKGGTPVAGLLVNGRSKLSRGRTVGDDSEAENTDRPLEEEEEEEEELKDFYGPPTGLVPLGI